MTATIARSAALMGALIMAGSPGFPPRELNAAAILRASFPGDWDVHRNSAVSASAMHRSGFAEVSVFVERSVPGHRRDGLPEERISSLQVWQTSVERESPGEAKVFSWTIPAESGEIHLSLALAAVAGPQFRAEAERFAAVAAAGLGYAPRAVPKGAEAEQTPPSGLPPAAVAAAGPAALVRRGPKGKQRYVRQSPMRVGAYDGGK